MSSLQPRNLRLLIGATVAASFVYLASREALRVPARIIPSPREEVAKLSKRDRDALPYPPDALPGARDVASPYGSIRIYEFGPEIGRKVLIIHGISTPCISLSTLAHTLVSKGCRVLLLDLFGRGYSDSPDLPHDLRLYTSQILLAITSSPLPWTPEGFSVIGYSFGGGVVADFAASFPELVRSVVLLAPGGLIRERHFNRQSRIMFSGWVPPRLLEWIVRRRLGGDEVHKPTTETGDGDRPTTNEEIKGNRDPLFESTVISPSIPHVTIGHVVEWQLRHHPGFVRSFISSMRFGPTRNRQAAWRTLRQREDKVLIIVGSDDSVIDARELREDALEVLGEEKVVWKVLEGVGAGHEFPISRAEEVGEIIGEFWEI